MSKSEFGRTVERLNEQSAIVGRMPCLWCKELTLVATLNQHGARCFWCFEAYCAEGLRGGVDGFAQGAPDTPTQADMRKHLRGFKPANVLNRTDSGELDPDLVARAKRDAQAKFDAFSRMSVSERTQALRSSGDIAAPDEREPSARMFSSQQP